MNIKHEMLNTCVIPGPATNIGTNVARWYQRWYQRWYIINRFELSPPCRSRRLPLDLRKFFFKLFRF